MLSCNRSRAGVVTLCLIAAAGCGGGASPPGLNQGGGGASSTSPHAGGGGSSGLTVALPDAGPSDTPDASNIDIDGSVDGGGSICGNGVVESGETCDDSNTKPGDGCDGTCQTEPGFCGNPPIRCTPAAKCGNSTVETGETCDDGTNDGTQGCSTTCLTMPGWICPSGGGACTKNGFCGDTVVQSTGGEQCDDGTNDGAHGCTSKCLVVTGWKCPSKGGACSPDTYCGNGVVDPGEQCDDHNRRSYDGCSSTCFIETGWSCPPTGGACTRICGNGGLDSGEACDDGNIYSGDGCSSTCQVEKNYTCPTVGSPCIYTPPPPPPQCGNDVVEAGETCDDGNANGGDGCSSSCKLEDGWACKTPGTPCVAAKCGDGILAGTEQCDDGICDNNHGCSTTCTIMPNAVCPASGGACIPMVCGDGKVTGTEGCDDLTNDGKHGCSTTCQIVTGWLCPLPGTPCTPICGDGIVAGNEQCDEGADVPCCGTDCKLKPGFVCDPSQPVHSQPASAYCGDGIVDGPSNPASPVRGNEQCDDKNNVPFDGCSPTCTNEPLCGNLDTYLANPSPVPYQCFAHCGDGLVMAPEQCDDGNAQDGDGCDHDCNIETIPGTSTPAWTCTQPAPSGPLVLPVVWRDFEPETHPQFSIDPLVNRRMPNITMANLQPVALGGGKYKYVPGYNTKFASPAWGAQYNGNAYMNAPDWTMNGPGWNAGFEGWKQPQWMATTWAYYSVDLVWWADSTPVALSSAAGTPVLNTPAGRFAQWYVDDPTVNYSFPGSITLAQTGTGTYRYSCDTTGCDSAFPASPSGFFPLDGRGWVLPQPAGKSKETPRDGGHNYSFTTETRYWFTYQGGERLDFFGDDDLWVFVNGKLTLDIGGIHQKLRGYFTLGTAGSAQSCAQNLPDPDPLPANYQPTYTCAFVTLGLQIGQVYEIAVFNAEREVLDSNFQLTLAGFNGSPSVCTPICGDGYVVGSEQCDRGAGNVNPVFDTYGKCTTSCTLGPFCGDHSVQVLHETCDNGLNVDTYETSTPVSGMCAPLCVAPVYCGDKVVQKTYGEECDNGADNANTYNHCQTNCKLGPRCGDGQQQSTQGEGCDDGPNNGQPSSLCGADCQLKCGNRTLETGEQCDDGPANGTATSLCTSECQNKCGNGQLDPGEQCDDGKNDGSYGTCNPDCTQAAYCGDSATTSPPEACDNGAANSPTAYGLGSCTDQCLPGGTCGDGIINGAEKCDDGKNTGLAGSCTTDCSGYVPPASCGDGTVQAPEQCDDGSGSNGNGSAASKCDISCRWKCGNGTIDDGETCDNGVNDGSYGTCTPTCQIGSYCNDGHKDGPEQCDNGSANVPIATAYGANVCTTACKWAPFCGDGRVQTQFNEQCEGTTSCDNCQISGGPH